MNLPIERKQYIQIYLSIMLLYHFKLLHNNIDVTKQYYDLVHLQEICIVVSKRLLNIIVALLFCTIFYWVCVEWLMLVTPSFSCNGSGETLQKPAIESSKSSGHLLVRCRT